MVAPGSSGLGLKRKFSRKSSDRGEGQAWVSSCSTEISADQYHTSVLYGTGQEGLSGPVLVGHISTGQYLLHCHMIFAKIFVSTLVRT